jgi:hypothetical protein
LAKDNSFGFGAVATTAVEVFRYAQGGADLPVAMLIHVINGPIEIQMKLISNGSLVGSAISLVPRDRPYSLVIGVPVGHHIDIDPKSSGAAAYQLSV